MPLVRDNVFNDWSPGYIEKYGHMADTIAAARLVMALDKQDGIKINGNY